jgi:hypothetical protein
MITFDKREDPESDTKFVDWCNKNPHGFYLNPKSKKKFLLHTSTCDHAGDLSPGSSPTKNPKHCSIDPQELESWAAQSGAAVSRCSDCL